MVKSVFISPLQLDKIEDAGANHLIVVAEGLADETWEKLKRLNINLSISINAFGPDGCPANPAAKEKLFQKFNNALKLQPKEIWIDHFRFDGHWEEAEGEKIPGVHPKCEFCAGKTRALSLKQTAREVMELADGKTKVGYFVVPFRDNEVPELIEGLGQDHLSLGRVLDMSSPMLYQQMIKKSTSYISEYVKWLYDKTQKPILPIIQVSSMPDDLEDTISEDIITSEFQEATKDHSIGACFFWWAHALETGKTGIIQKLFSSSS